MKDNNVRGLSIFVLISIFCTSPFVKAQQTGPPSNNQCQNAIHIGDVVNQAFNIEISDRKEDFYIIPIQSEKIMTAFQRSRYIPRFNYGGTKNEACMENAER